MFVVTTWYKFLWSVFCCLLFYL